MITVTYDPEGDCLYVKRQGAVIVNSDTDKDVYIVRNYAADGTIVGLQLLDADAVAQARLFSGRGLPYDIVQAVRDWMAQR